MENNNHIQEELRSEIPLIADIAKNNLFSVPDFYFDNLSEEIFKKIAVGVEPVYAFSNNMPYSVPEGYFDNVSKNILDNISFDRSVEMPVFEEMETISPLLNTISKKAVFTTPDGYFSSTNFTVPVVEKPAVVSMAGRPRGFMRYAVAAVIATILGIGIFLITGKETNTSVAASEVSKQVKTLSEEEIVAFLKKSAPNENISFASPNGGKEKEIKKLVSQMSDEEIESFLQETGEIDEI
jgi:hypothetical protein